MMMNDNKEKNIGILLAAGYGDRFNSHIPKQFHEINGKEVISYSIDAFKKSEKIDDFVVVLSDSEMKSKRVADTYGVKVIAGGEDRAHSFQNALNHIKNVFPACENVIFHEAARPLVTYDVFNLYFDFLGEYDYVTSCKHITDSLGSYLPTPPNREDFYLIQAPEAYRVELLYKYFDAESKQYFAANQFPRECKGKLYFNIKNNYKLTYPEDVKIIEALL